MTSSERLDFKVIAQDSWSRARATEFSTRRGRVQTPIFMPVATQAALRGVDMALADAMGYQVLLANTYHLLLRPGPEIFRKVGGIHSFMKWPGLVLTDSGGFQIFSLSRQLKLSEEGAAFRSYVDGRQVLLTPELSIQTQAAIGSDIMMVLDHCIDSTSDETTTRAALALTARWAKRSYAARAEDSTQALFGIVQGACFKELRKESAELITQIPFDGFALGGLAVGETKAEREDMVEFSAPLLPENRPRYLMGVGTPIDLLEAVKRGMDMFDCILPTSLAHQGVCFTSKGKIDLRRGVYREAEEVLDPACSCSTCSRFSRAYLSHLVRADEFISDQLLSIHNLAFYRSLMQRMRDSILAGQFRAFYESERSILLSSDVENPSRPPKRRPALSETTLGDYEVIEHANGYGSVRQISSGETMHSVSEPMAEAKSLYIDQSAILTARKSSGDPIVIWDVGLGAATNAMSLILNCEADPEQAREVHLISFESDLDSLRLALLHPGLFKHIRHAAPHALLEDSFWKSPKVPLEWKLVQGDFLETFNAASTPDLIWFDPFSYKVDSELWNVETFRKILACCADKETRIFTYTASTAARAAMLAAGWYVGAGVGTGPKTETTIAYTPAAARLLSAEQLLGEAWLQRWRRSDAKQPHGSTGEALLERIERHPQFCTSIRSCP
ncbi:MAG: tRNA guanosine(34) transglycosylase Tgt [Deltaproteobacteria bacterium]|nr:tRNA guanosine(34) transglycosylase Tgt [Deltaproteobacteria bacterium]